MPIPLLLALAAAAAPPCPVIDQMPDWRAFLARTAGAAPAVRAAATVDAYMPAHGSFYRPVRDRARAVSLLTGWFADPANAAPPAAALTAEQVAAAFPPALARFSARLPDFRCGATVMLGWSFGEFDGQTRQGPDGRPLLLFGADVIARTHGPASLPVLFDHELFHLYHAQLSPADMQEPADTPTPVIVALWAEGLATYASHAMNPRAGLADILWNPRDLDAQVDARRREMAAQLAADLRGAPDEAAYRLWFNAAPNARGWPMRAGYYLGYRLAERLGRTRSLAELARLDRATVTREAEAWLAEAAR